jgi:hypothetical protein
MDLVTSPGATQNVFWVAHLITLVTSGGALAV